MNRTRAWYKELRKPCIAPPSWIFGPVWTVLYVIIAVSFGYTAWATFTHVIPISIFLPFGLNLFFNFLYTPLQFRWRNLLAATVDIFLVLVTLLWALNAIYPFYPWVSYVNIPYFLWVSFATILQVTITLMNRNKWVV